METGNYIEYNECKENIVLQTLLPTQDACPNTTQLALAAILLENIIFRVDEGYLLRHVSCVADDRKEGNVTTATDAQPTTAPEHLATIVGSALNSCFHATIGEHPSTGDDCPLNITDDANALLFMNILKLFTTGLLQFHKYNAAVECFKRTHLNRLLIDSALDMPQRIATTATATPILLMAATVGRNVIHIFNQFLLSIDCGRMLWLRGMHKLTMTAFDIQTTTEILMELCTKYVSSFVCSILFACGLWPTAISKL